MTKEEIAQNDLVTNEEIAKNDPISPFATIFSTFSHRLSYSFKNRDFLVFDKYVQSCLMQRERVNRLQNLSVVLVSAGAIWHNFKIILR